LLYFVPVAGLSPLWPRGAGLALGHTARCWLPLRPDQRLAARDVRPAGEPRWDPRRFRPRVDAKPRLWAERCLVSQQFRTSRFSAKHEKTRAVGHQRGYHNYLYGCWASVRIAWALVVLAWVSPRFVIPVIVISVAPRPIITVFTGPPRLGIPIIPIPVSPSMLLVPARLASPSAAAMAFYAIAQRTVVSRPLTPDFFNR
jgi:hypothetical protein